MPYEIDDRVVVNENSYWAGAVGKHGTVRSVNDPDSGFPVGRPIEVHLDGQGGNAYFSEDMIDPEVI